MGSRGGWGCGGNPGGGFGVEGGSTSVGVHIGDRLGRGCQLVLGSGGVGRDVGEVWDVVVGCGWGVCWCAGFGLGGVLVFVWFRSCGRVGFLGRRLGILFGLKEWSVAIFMPVKHIWARDFVIPRPSCCSAQTAGVGERYEPP